MKGYTITYQPGVVINGERGWSYEIRYCGRLIGAGWSAGKKKDAEDDVRDTIRKREGKAA